MSENEKKPQLMTILIVILVAVIVITFFVVITSKILGADLSFTTAGLAILAAVFGVLYFFLVLKDKMGL